MVRSCTKVSQERNAEQLSLCCCKAWHRSNKFPLILWLKVLKSGWTLSWERHHCDSGVIFLFYFKFHAQWAGWIGPNKYFSLRKLLAHLINYFYTVVHQTYFRKYEWIFCKAVKLVCEREELRLFSDWLTKISIPIVDRALFIYWFKQRGQPEIWKGGG